MPLEPSSHPTSNDWTSFFHHFLEFTNISGQKSLVNPHRLKNFPSCDDQLHLINDSSLEYHWSRHLNRPCLLLLESLLGLFSSFEPSICQSAPLWYDLLCRRGERLIVVSQSWLCIIIHPHLSLVSILLLEWVLDLKSRPSRCHYYSIPLNPGVILTLRCLIWYLLARLGLFATAW